MKRIVTGTAVLLLIAAFGLAATLQRGSVKPTSSTSSSESPSTSTVATTSPIDVGETLPTVTTEITYRPYGCGANTRGQVGVPTEGQSVLQPIPIEAPEPKKIASGLLHSLMIDTEGHLYSWGDNTFGQCGHQDTGVVVEPRLVQGLEDRTFIAIGAGWFHSLAVDSEGWVWTFGNNSSGQLGNGRLGPWRAPTPARINMMADAVSVAGGMAHSMALTSQGILFVWGNNFFRQVNSDGTMDLVSFLQTQAGRLPESVPSNPQELWAWLESFLMDLADDAKKLVALEPQSIFRDVRAIAAGATHSLAVLSDKTVAAWGSNLAGECGDGRFLVFASGFVQVKALMGLSIDTLTEAESVAGGMFHSMVLREEGTVYGFGYNQEGQLGLGIATPPSPIGVKVPGLKEVDSISLSYGHTVACLRDGTAQAWGLNSHGELGLGYTAPFIATPTTILGISQVARAAAGGSHTLFVAP